MASKEELRVGFAETIARVQKTLANASPETLLESRSIQGFDTNVLDAIYSTVTHLEGHGLQIAYITHLLTGDAYVPFWKPENEAQGV